MTRPLGPAVVHGDRGATATPGTTSGGAAGTSSIPAYVVRAVVALARAALMDAPAPRDPRAMVVGAPGPAAREALEAATAGLTVIEAPDGDIATSADEAFDVIAALGWLHRLDEPQAALRALAGRSEHLVLATPREPLAARGVRVHGGRSWSSPGFLRFASTVGAVREVAHPLGWTVLWVRAA